MPRGRTSGLSAAVPSWLVRAQLVRVLVCAFVSYLTKWNHGVSLSIRQCPGGFCVLSARVSDYDHRVMASVQEALSVW